VPSALGLSLGRGEGVTVGESSRKKGGAIKQLFPPFIGRGQGIILLGGGPQEGM